MLVNIHHDSKREHNRLLVAGVVFLTAIALLVALSIAVYQKRFDTVTMVEIHADRAGLQLATFGDVRIHGVLVGQVRSVSQDGEEAVIKVALEPDAAERHPGERRRPDHPDHAVRPEVHLVRAARRPVEGVAAGRPGHPVRPGRDHRRAEQDPGRPVPAAPGGRAGRPQHDAQRAGHRPRAAAATSSARPSTSSTPTSARSATSCPTLRQDLISLANVADTYDLAAPDLIDVLGNLTVTSKTIIEKADDLDVFFSDLQGLAVTSTRVLSDNEHNLIQVGKVTEPVLKLLAIYSPEFPCLIKGAAKYAPRAGQDLRRQPGQAVPRVRHRPVRALPRRRPPGVRRGRPRPVVLRAAQPRRPDRTGVVQGRDRHRRQPADVAAAHPGDRRAHRSAARALGDANASGYAGTDAEKAIVNALLAGETGRAADSYGALGSLLYGPVVRGGDGP